MIASASAWADQQWGGLDLGDERLNRRAAEIGARMAADPQASLPRQMQTQALLASAYRLLNHRQITLEQLMAPHRAETLRLAGQQAVVLLVEDTTELDYTAHRAKAGLGPIGNGRGQGLLLHSTLAVVPDSRQVLGLAHIQAVLRVRHDKSKKWPASPEGAVWQVSAEQTGRPPAGVTWVHVSDSGSDIYQYLATCRALGKHFVVRACRNRVLLATESEPAGSDVVQHLLDHARSLPPAAASSYTITVPAHDKQPARQATIVQAWTQVVVAPPVQAPAPIRAHGPLTVWLLRAWEPDPPPEVKEAVEWVLLCSLPIQDLADAQRCIAWYSCRWLCEDYHQCLKTGCRIEKRQLDDGADIERLLGFLAPIAVRLLQLRQAARRAPDEAATTVFEPLLVQVLAQRYHLDWRAVSLEQFYRHVAMLGGYLGRRRDGPPGWRTLWHGWRYLSDLTDGARLVASGALPLM